MDWGYKSAKNFLKHLNPIMDELYFGWSFFLLLLFLFDGYALHTAKARRNSKIYVPRSKSN